MTFRWVLPLALGLAFTVQASAENGPPPCHAPAEFLSLDQPLTRTALALASGDPVTIVAIGSSSTGGAGATRPENSYPARLEAELRLRYPDADITVVNAGVNGEDAAQMIARFDKDVFAHQPDLVLWQVGTNAVLRDMKVDGQVPIILDGIRRLKAADTDVVIVDSQYAPKVLAKADIDIMTAFLHRVAREQKVGIFRRFDIMRRWKDVDHITYAQSLSSDGLHMNDWSYGCIAKLFSTAIVDAVRSPAIAKMPRAR